MSTVAQVWFSAGNHSLDDVIVFSLGVQIALRSGWTGVHGAADSGGLRKCVREKEDPAILVHRYLHIAEFNFR